MNHIERIQTIKNALPKLAKELVITTLDQKQVWNADFAEDLDNPMHHKPEWHQWGILTHTQKFLEAHNTEVPQFLAQWNMSEQVAIHLACTIDGISKAELIETGILFHDIGKFSKRKLSKKQTNTDSAFPDFTFGLHEAESEQLVHAPEIYSFLSTVIGLTSPQIFYIGRVTALHYELAKIRDKMLYSPGKDYSYEFVSSESYRTESLHTLWNNPHFGVEIGLLYLGDTLAKTEFRLSPLPTSEDEASSHIWKFIPMLEQREIDPRHIAAIITQPLSIYASQKYLEHIFAYIKKELSV